MISIIVFIVIPSALGALVLRTLLAWYRRGIIARAEIEREFFESVRILADSDKLSEPMLRRLDMMLRLVRHPWLAFVISWWFATGAMAHVRPTKEQLRAVAQERESLPEGLRPHWMRCIIFFALALTYNAPLIGTLARSALVRFAVEPNSKRTDWIAAEIDAKAPTFNCNHVAAAA